MRVYKPPGPVAPDVSPVVFAAGSIDMGAAVDWQSELATALDDLDGALLNPRRDEWDASWRQSIDSPLFREQVEWELDGLDRADVIAMWFAADSKAPITLLELGLHARSGRVIVGCPSRFWRRGNIEIVCARFDVPLVPDWPAFVATVRARLTASAPSVARR